MFNRRCCFCQSLHRYSRCGHCLFNGGDNFLFGPTSARGKGVLAHLIAYHLWHHLASCFQVPIPEANRLVQNDTYRVNGSFTGLTSSATIYENLWPHYGRDYTSPDGALVSFATVFGVLFSGVTGIMAGANMSGELKDPSKSIPRGTLSAVGFTGMIYVLLSLLTASTCSNFLLQNDYLFMMVTTFLPNASYVASA